jgi:hypothetical protein
MEIKMEMDLTNENSDQVAGLTVEDLGLASWALGDVHNHMLAVLEEKQEDVSNDVEGASQEVENLTGFLDKLNISFTKYDRLFRALQPQPDEEPAGPDDKPMAMPEALQTAEDKALVEAEGVSESV